MSLKGKSGILYVCPTPIGNLEDITLRVLRVLKEADLIAAEDTRVTGKLLTRYGISKPVVSYREYVEDRRIEKILSHLKEGKSVALVSDAGTPGLSDPGYKLIREAIERGYRLEVLPGPAAAITALVASGLPTDSFLFEGFLPRKAEERRRLLKELLQSGRTVVVYEAPHRILKLLKELSEVAPQRRVAVARGLTKKFEEVVRGTAAEVAKLLGERPRGEMVVVIDKGVPPERRLSPDELKSEVERLIALGVSRRDAVAEAARRVGLPRRKVYEAIKAVDRKGA